VKRWPREKGKECNRKSAARVTLRKGWLMVRDSEGRELIR
jgi:hypothetical protein